MGFAMVFVSYILALVAVVANSITVMYAGFRIMGQKISCKPHKRVLEYCEDTRHTEKRMPRFWESEAVCN